MIVRITRAKVGHRQAPHKNKALLVRALSFGRRECRFAYLKNNNLLKAMESYLLRQFHFLSRCLFVIMLNI